MKYRLRLLTLAFMLVLTARIANPSYAGSDLSVVRISSTLTRTSDQSGLLSVTADVAKGFHIYAQSQPRPFLATKITVAKASEVRVVGTFTASRLPKIIKHPTLGVELHEFEGQVTWTAPVELSPTPGVELIVQGTVFTQACEESRCLAPETYEFKATLPIARVASPLSAVADAGTKPRQPADPEPPSGGFSLDQIEGATAESGSYSVWVVLPLAFVAGLLLNLMPCVLPVVGLKILSFVQQSNDSRRRVLLLNVVYSFGLLSVMLVLATLAVFAGLGWGEQFSSTRFNVTLTAIVFAFGLSFLGVWEIPVPGFGAGKGEGYGGAFSKGVLSTLLATPCSGPFLGSALAWAIVQPTYLTYAVFASVGLGMASPYLVVGLFPQLVRFLPKPGNWMVTFKQVMGFVLLATVIYLLGFISAPNVVPTALLLLGISFGCWWVGRVSLLESRGRILRAWTIATLSVAATAWLSFGWLEGVMAERFQRAAERLLATRSDLSRQFTTSPRHANDGIAWQPFSQKKLETLVKDGTPVFVDFTADWCLTCQANEAAAINRPEVATLIRDKGIVALRADKTEPSPEVDALLRRLGNKSASIPFYAIFPADAPGRPILLDGIFTSPEPILHALRQAGASRNAKTAHLAPMKQKLSLPSELR